MSKKKGGLNDVGKNASPVKKTGFPLLAPLAGAAARQGAKAIVKQGAKALAKHGAFKLARRGADAANEIDDAVNGVGPSVARKNQAYTGTKPDRIMGQKADPSIRNVPLKSSTKKPVIRGA